MNGKSFPRLAAVQWGDGGDTGPLEEAAKKLKEVRNYLFYEVKAEDAVSSRDSKEPANPENMVELRRFLERIEDRLDAVITHHSASEADGRPGPADGPPGASQDAASRDISQAGQAVREKARAARKAVRRTKGIAEDWGRLRDDLSRPKEVGYVPGAAGQPGGSGGFALGPGRPAGGVCADRQRDRQGWIGPEQCRADAASAGPRPRAGRSAALRTVAAPERREGQLMARGQARTSPGLTRRSSNAGCAPVWTGWVPYWPRTATSRIKPPGRRGDPRSPRPSRTRVPQAGWPGTRPLAQRSIGDFPAGPARAFADKRRSG